ncbi:hypothetical protein [Sphingomonas sp. NFX23]
MPHRVLKNRRLRKSDQGFIPSDGKRTRQIADVARTEDVAYVAHIARPYL